MARRLTRRAEQRGRGLRRGDIYDAQTPGGPRPVVVVTRDDALPLLTAVVVAAITSTVRGHVAEVEVGPDEGVREPSAVNCDNLYTIPVSSLGRRRGSLGVAKIAELDRALVVALGLPSSGPSGR